MVTYVKEGNIFDVGVFNFAHGCNCAGAMGKGIALQFKKKFPLMYNEYRKLCNERLFNLGDVFIYNYDNGVIFNLGTQSTWKAKADLKAIETSFDKMLSYSSSNQITKISIPKIGAGLGGLEWSDVKEVIERSSKKYPQIDLWVVESFKE